MSVIVKQKESNKTRDIFAKSIQQYKVARSFAKSPHEILVATTYRQTILLLMKKFKKAGLLKK